MYTRLYPTLSCRVGGSQGHVHYKDPTLIACRAFVLVIMASEGEDVDHVFEGLDVDAETKDMLVTYIRRRLAPKALKVRADIEVTCFHYEGIDAIKVMGCSASNDLVPYTNALCG
jgi:hypothetical protein